LLSRRLSEGMTTESVESQHANETVKEVIQMFSKMVAMVLALAFVGVVAMAPNADARRGVKDCSTGGDDIGTFCPHP
jgi:hypothetical protein